MPLVVEFTANIVDSWGHAIKYNWDFGDGQTASNTTSNQIKHTYADKNNYTAMVSGVSDIQTPTANCPASATIDVKAWTNQNQQEVAP